MVVFVVGVFVVVATDTGAGLGWCVVWTGLWTGWAGWTGCWTLVWVFQRFCITG